MRPDDRYKDSRAFWAAAVDRMRTHSKTTGIALSRLQQQFVYDRFLARVFQDTAGGWVLKGGNAVIARVIDARKTNDIDLLQQITDLDEARTRLAVAVASDLGDFFRFVPQPRAAASSDAGQPQIDGLRLGFDAYIGTKRQGSIKVDLVVGSIMTTHPDEATYPTITMSGLEPAALRLYPVVDHIADKLCATQDLYGVEQKRSSRVRDLVDLVVFATSHDLDGAKLTTAIWAEWGSRGLAGDPTLEIPPEWATVYPRAVKDVRAAEGYADFESACDLVYRLVLPACQRMVSGQIWHKDRLEWSQP